LTDVDFHALVCHPAESSPSIGAIDAGFALADACLAFRYRLRGDMARIRAPRAQTAERCDFLWKHTCLEAFVGVEGRAAYREFNFSPSGQWAAYDFGDYRQGLADPEGEAPRMNLYSTEEGIEMKVSLPLSFLPACNTAWEIGLAAVIETDKGLSHWALRHLLPHPDFHLRGSFILRQPLPMG
jgi:hypothetical protein